MDRAIWTRRNVLRRVIWDSSGCHGSGARKRVLGGCFGALFFIMSTILYVFDSSTVVKDQSILVYLVNKNYGSAMEIKHEIVFNLKI